MSFSNIAVPSNYGYVIVSSVIGCGFIVSMYMGGEVMKAREKFNVPYPSLYAVPGFHKDADAFNRVQRGHQAYFELLPQFLLLALIGGLKYPVACTIHSVFFAIGSICFQIGYADTTLDVKTARYKKGGQIKWIAFLGVMYCAVSLCGTISGWW